jgi:hypothetical protein
MARAFSMTINTLGAPMKWVQAKAPKATAEIIAGFRAVGVRDVALVNAYGVEAKIITVRAGTTPVPPAKFDSFEVAGEVYVAQAVHEVHANERLLGYKLFCKGR